MATTTASAKKVHVHGGKTKTRIVDAQKSRTRIVDAQAKRSSYDPEANVVPGRPKPGKKPSDYCGIWRRNRPE